MLLGAYTLGCGEDGLWAVCGTRTVHLQDKKRESGQEMNPAEFKQGKIFFRRLWRRRSDMCVTFLCVAEMHPSNGWTFTLCLLYCPVCNVAESAVLL